jgi:RES domain-containing protein
MMGLEVYRISPTPYIHLLDGQGAKLYGGRWNSEGLAAIYTSTHRSLALIEILVHMSPMELKVREYSLATIFIPDLKLDSIPTIELSQLPYDWILHEYTTQTIGDHFLKQNKSIALKVPSAVVNEEYNIILNPNHSLMKSVIATSTKRLDIDKRLVKTG